MKPYHAQRNLGYKQPSVALSNNTTPAAVAQPRIQAAAYQRKDIDANVAVGAMALCTGALKSAASKQQYLKISAPQAVAAIT